MSTFRVTHTSIICVPWTKLRSELSIVSRKLADFVRRGIARAHAGGGETEQQSLILRAYICLATKFSQLDLHTPVHHDRHSRRPNPCAVPVHRHRHTPSTITDTGHCLSGCILGAGTGCPVRCPVGLTSTASVSASERVCMVVHRQYPPATGQRMSVVVHCQSGRLHQPAPLH